MSGSSYCPNDSLPPANLSQCAWSFLMNQSGFAEKSIPKSIARLIKGPSNRMLPSQVVADDGQLIIDHDRVIDVVWRQMAAYFSRVWQRIRFDLFVVPDILFHEKEPLWVNVILPHDSREFFPVGNETGYVWAFASKSMKSYIPIVVMKIAMS